MSSGGMYPESPSFKEALRQARERAAAVNRARSQPATTAPDPPESGAPRPKVNKPKERRGLMSAANSRSGQQAHGQQPTPPQPERVPERNATTGTAAATAAAGAQQQAAAAMYHLPIQGQLGAMAAHGRAPTLFERLRLRDLQNQMALRQEQAALYGATISGRPPPGVHWGAHPPGMLPPTAEERWRVAQGLPGSFAAGRGGLHPSVAAHPLGAQMLANLPQPTQPAVIEGEEEDKAESSLPGDSGKDAKQVSMSANPAASGRSTADVAGSSALFDLLATAAEDTLKREEEKKKMADKGEEPEGDDDKPASKEQSQLVADKKNGVPKMIAVTHTGNKNAKRKRKAANEPKNPLGAFVFYQRKIMAEVFEENPCITFGEAAAECGKRWRALPEAEKLEYKEMASRDKERYARELEVHKRGKNKSEEVAVIPTKPSKPPARKKKPVVDSDPKRAKSAFQFYKAEEMAVVKKEFPNVTNAEASTECSARYKALSKIEKQKYEKMAEADRARYKREVGETGDQVSKTSAEKSRDAKSTEGVDAVGVSAAGTKDDLQQNKVQKVSKRSPPPRARSHPKIKYTDMVDHNKCYVEEHAWRYHNPPLPVTREDDKRDESIFEAVSPEQLRPLPPPPPPPTKFPNTGYCSWSYDYDTRVLHADFRRKDGPPVVTYEDEQYMLQMFERDDLTLVSEGLVSGLDCHKWNLDYLARVAGDEYYHRFRRFDKGEPEKSPLKPKKKPKSKDPSDNTEAEDCVGVAHSEIDKCLSMRVSDFVRYVRQRGTALAVLDAVTSAEEIEEDGLCHFSWKDHNGDEQSVDVSKTVLYMIDFDLVKLLPTLYEDFKACYALGDAVLPGGSHCMMNCVNSNGRPDLGPNLYITPPGSFTHFHQDGHGTVDSGHYCLSGYNEVVMTRRLTERAKRHALYLLTGTYKKKKGPFFEGLYDLPHADCLGEKPKWPDNEAVSKCNEMNYCVSRFILKEGQCVHINKGRLHAFRKVTNELLPYSVPASPSDDCHAFLRANLKMPGTDQAVVGPGKPEILCISVAWDWMFRGVTAKGINREVISTLECAALNRKHGAMSLAIPELSLIQMARTLAPKSEEKTSLPGAYRESLFGIDSHCKKARAAFTPDSSEVCRGIFPGLQHVVKQHIDAINIAESLKSKSFERYKRVSIASRPNAWENPVTHPLDPYGNSDFFCKLCNKELSNVYLHCDGCELLLSKDFNICIECHQEKRYATSVQMHPLNNKRHSTINHIGNMTLDRGSRCPCKNGPVCRHCNFCAGCSCRCHTWFTMHHRFFKKDDELMLLHRVKRVVGREDLEAAAEAEKRLSMAIKGRFNDDGEVGPFGLHSMDGMVDQDTNELEEPEEDRSHDSEMEQDPPAPVGKNSGVLSDEPEPMETSSLDDDTELGRVTNDGIEITVEDMKVTIRCPPGTFSLNGPGIDRTSFSHDDDTDESDDEDDEDATGPRRYGRGTNQDYSVSTESETLSNHGRYRDDDSDDETEEEEADTKETKVQTNTGRWTDEERERLRIALIREPDMDSVVKYVGSRQFPAIRSYAPRTFPKLFEELRERMERNKSKSKGRRKSKSPKAVKVEPSTRNTRSRDPPESVDVRPKTRRSSRRGSQKPFVAADSEAEESSTDEPSEDEQEDAAWSGTSKARLKVPPRGTKSPVPQLSQSAVLGRRRATLDLSGGLRRKRRNGGAGLARQVDPPVEGDNSEANSSDEPCPPSKRAKIEGPEDKAVTCDGSKEGSKAEATGDTVAEAMLKDKETVESETHEVPRDSKKCEEEKKEAIPVPAVEGSCVAVPIAEVEKGSDEKTISAAKDSSKDGEGKEAVIPCAGDATEGSEKQDERKEPDGRTEVGTSKEETIPSDANAEKVAVKEQEAEEEEGKNAGGGPILELSEELPDDTKKEETKLENATVAGKGKEDAKAEDATVASTGKQEARAEDASVAVASKGEEEAQAGVPKDESKVEAAT